MKIYKQIDINAPTDKVWETIGINYADVGKWASAVYQSSIRSGKTIADAPCYGRLCQTSLGQFTEALVAYDNSNHSLSYVAKGDKMPFFVKQLKASWKLTPNGHNKTTTEMSFDCDIAFPFNVMMGWMMKMQFNKAISETMEDLQYYLETGEVHPRKVENTKKQSRLAID